MARRLDLNPEKLMAKKIVATGTAIFLVIAMAVVVKLVFFPSVNDSFFQISQARLRQAPPGIVIVRPTHFANASTRPSPQQDIGVVNVKGTMWMVGRNIAFQRKHRAGRTSVLRSAAFKLGRRYPHTGSTGIRRSRSPLVAVARLVGARRHDGRQTTGYSAFQPI